MKPTVVLATLALLLVPACRIAHLGKDHGVAFHGAREAQRTSDPGRTPTFGADDAKGTLAARRDAGGGDDGAAAPASLVVPMPAPTSSSSSGAWPGATGNITLEAK